MGSSTEYARSGVPLAEDAPLATRGFFGLTKAAGSLLLLATAAERGIRVAVLRAFQVYGPATIPADSCRRCCAPPAAARSCP